MFLDCYNAPVIIMTCIRFTLWEKRKLLKYLVYIMDGMRVVSMQCELCMNVNK